jgi:hypothetical protein
MENDRNSVDLNKSVLDTAWELEAKKREQALVDMVEARPDLRRFVLGGNIRRAQDAFVGIDKFLKNHGEILKLLNESYERNPEFVHLSIIPDFPLVFAQSENGVVALAPVLVCTLNAIDAVKKGLLSDRNFRIIRSKLQVDEMEEAAWDWAANERKDLIKFDPTYMNPADYIAIAATMFENEVFRRKI